MRDASAPTPVCLATGSRGSRPMCLGTVESDPAEQLPAIPGPAVPSPVWWGPAPLNVMVPTSAGPTRG